jgi:hypothetical protein
MPTYGVARSPKLSAFSYIVATLLHPDTGFYIVTILAAKATFTKAS